MLHWLIAGDKLCPRKARLFQVACCRRAWSLLHDERSRGVVEVAERYADGMASHEELTLAWKEAAQAASERGAWGAFAASAAASTASPWGDLPNVTAKSAADAVACHAQWTANAAFDATRAAELCGPASLLRDLLGPLPFRPVKVEPSWLTPVVVSLANSIYDGRDFAAMPVLADALEEAGADNHEVLQHLREEGVRHVRGCWCLDLLLGKG
jgi:hypothetical protein